MPTATGQYISVPLHHWQDESHDSNQKWGPQPGNDEIHSDTASSPHSTTGTVTSEGPTISTPSPEAAETTGCPQSKRSASSTDCFDQTYDDFDTDDNAMANVPAADENTPSQILLHAKFNSFEQFEQVFNDWKSKNYHPFRVASSEMMRRVDGTQEPVFRYRYIVYHCVHYGLPRMRGNGKRPNQNYLPSGCKAMLRLNHSYTDNALRITTLHSEHTNHEIGPGLGVVKVNKASEAFTSSAGRMVDGNPVMPKRRKTKDQSPLECVNPNIDCNIPSPESSLASSIATGTTANSSTFPSPQQLPQQLPGANAILEQLRLNGPQLEFPHYRPDFVQQPPPPPPPAPVLPPPELPQLASFLSQAQARAQAAPQINILNMLQNLTAGQNLFPRPPDFGGVPAGASMGLNQHNIQEAAGRLDFINLFNTGNNASAPPGFQHEAFRLLNQIMDKSAAVPQLNPPPFSFRNRQIANELDETVSLIFSTGREDVTNVVLTSLLTHAKNLLPLILTRKDVI